MPHSNDPTITAIVRRATLLGLLSQVWKGYLLARALAVNCVACTASWCYSASRRIARWTCCCRRLLHRRGFFQLGDDAFQQLVQLFDVGLSAPNQEKLHCFRRSVLGYVRVCFCILRVIDALHHQGLWGFQRWVEARPHRGVQAQDLGRVLPSNQPVLLWLSLCDVERESNTPTTCFVPASLR